MGRKAASIAIRRTPSAVNLPLTSVVRHERPSAGVGVGCLTSTIGMLGEFYSRFLDCPCIAEQHPSNGRYRESITKSRGVSGLPGGQGSRKRRSALLESGRGGFGRKALQTRLPSPFFSQDRRAQFWPAGHSRERSLDSGSHAATMYNAVGISGCEPPHPQEYPRKTNVISHLSGVRRRRPRRLATICIWTL